MVFLHTHTVCVLLEIVFGVVLCYMLFLVIFLLFLNANYLNCFSLLTVQLLCLYLGALPLWSCMFPFQKKLLACYISRDFM